MSEPAWKARGRCRSLGQQEKDAFFSVFVPDIDFAKSVCAHCPVVEPCLEEAIVHGETGVWGGTTETDRRELLAIVGRRRR